VDEENFELLVDGSHRRRRGLTREENGIETTIDGSSFTSDTAWNAHTWRNVGSNTDKHLHVVQAGYLLLFYNDSEGSVGTEFPAMQIDLTDWVVEGASLTPAEPLQMADLRGELYVVGRNIDPLQIAYVNLNGAESLEVENISLQVRDFWGIEDNIGILDKPTTETVTDAHKYNLQIRGFTDTNITYFFNTKKFYPAKNQVHFRAYRADGDDFIWDTSRLESTAFGRASAPTGHLLIDPLDTTKVSNYVQSVGLLSNAIAPADFNPVSPSVRTGAINSIYFGKRTGANAVHGGLFADEVTVSTQTLETPQTVQITLRLAKGVTAAADGQIKLEDFKIKYNNQQDKYNESYSVDKRTNVSESSSSIKWRRIKANKTKDISGTYDIVSVADQETIAGAGATGKYRTIVIEVDGFSEIYVDATVNKGAKITVVDGAHNLGHVSKEKYKAVASYAGRVCYAGAEHPKTADVVYYSQVLDGADRYGDCYQEADPTNETNNVLIDSDGGQIQIPELEGVVAMRPYQSSLLVFSRRGVWELSGGRQQYFSATNYEIRKLSDVHCVSGSGVAVGEQGVIFVAREGIMIIAPSENGYLQAQNITEGTIQKLWNAIPNRRQDQVKIVYDTVLKRVHILYSDDDTMPLNSFTKSLIFDLRLQAFYKYNYGGNTENYIVSAFASDANRSTDSRGRIKYVSYEPPYYEVAINDMDSTQFYDFTGVEAPAFIETAWDAPNNTVQKTQACYMKVYMRRTETGLLNGDPVNPASLTAQSKWGWADSGAGGKYGRAQQVYKRRRAQAVDEADTVLNDGTPVLCTKLKVRGRGEVLSIRFEGEAGKDAHLIGWATNYKIRRTS
jgi:hypothetical protein